MAFEYLAQYTTFESIADMDKSVEDHMAVHYYDLTESERAIVFKLASHSLEHPGACHLKAATIAAALEVSTKTVYRSFKKLAELGIIEKVPGTKLNGIKGASIYRILPYVPSSVSQREITDEASNDVVCHPQSENLSLNSFNLLSSKQATNNLCDLEGACNLQVTEKEKTKEYMNEYQVMLFDFMNSLPLADTLKDELHKVVLAAQVHCAPDFIKAKNVLFKIAMDIKEGVLTVASTLRAVFVGAYSKAVERLNSKTIVEDKAHRERPVPFYNWVVEKN